MSCAAAVFVKTPGHSPVKTRLAATAGRPAAERLHLDCADAVAAVLQACGDAVSPCFAVAETGARGAWPRLPTLPQGEGNLGQRLHQVYSTLQAAHGAALLLGADAPQLQARTLLQAAAALQSPGPAFVHGAAEDGGFWLFGGNRPLPAALWSALTYSSPTTGAQLLAALAALHPAEAVLPLPALRDLDSAEDVPSVLAALEALDHPLPEQRAVAQRLRALAPAANRRRPAGPR